LPEGSKTVAPSGGGILVAGVGKLLTVLAKCCKPAPPDPIIGFVTRGRGITIHRQKCASLSRLSEESAKRIIAADWDVSDDISKGERYEVDIEVEAQDRQGLLRDISNILLREKIDVTATRTQSRDIAAMQFTVKISGLTQLNRVLGLIQNVRGVTSVWRK
jgi:GTP pyrophosphokinase